MSAMICLAASGDEEVLAGLNASVQAFHVANHPQQFRPADLGEVAAWFRGLLGKPTVRIWIAQLDGMPVGYASAFWQERPQTPFGFARRWIEIDQIGVRPEFQRAGVGRQLVAQVFQAADADGIRDVELSSWCFNEGAHKAFARLGFAPQVVRFSRKSDVPAPPRR